MFSSNKKRNSLKLGQLKPFDLNKNENNRDISNKENIFNGNNINHFNTNNQFNDNVYNLSNKKLKEEFNDNNLDNFTSPEPYDFYLHTTNSDLSNPSTEAYNRAGSKNYFISETPTPFLYNDIVHKDPRTDTTKKNKPNAISNNNDNISGRSQNQKFYSNNYGLNLDKNEPDEDEDDLNQGRNSNKDYIQSIWSVSPPFSATRTEDTNLDAVVEEETEETQVLSTENSVYNSSTINEQKASDYSNNDIYDKEEPITYHNDYPSQDSNDYQEYSNDNSKNFESNNVYYTSSSASTSSKNHSKRNSFSMYNINSSTKTLPKAKSSSSINQEESHSNYNMFSRTRSLTSPTPISSNSKNMLKNSTTQRNSMFNNRISKTNNNISSNINSSLNSNSINNNHKKSFLSTSNSMNSGENKISSIRKSIIGNYYTLMEKNKLDNVHRRLNASKYSKLKPKSSIYSNNNQRPKDYNDVSEEFYYDSDSNQEEIVNQEYHSNTSSLSIIEKISLFIYKIINIISLCLYAIWKLLSSKITILFLLFCIYSQIYLVDENGNYSIMRWLKWAKLPEHDIHHQKLLNLENQLQKLETILTKLNKETEEIKADTPQAYLDQLNKEIEQLSVRLANVAEEASHSNLVNTKQKQDIQNLKHLSSNIEVNFNDLKTNVEDFNQIIKHVETKIDADKENQIKKLKQDLEPLLEKIIPKIMVAKINPTTRAIEFDERFWKYLSKNFLTIDSLKTLIKTHDEALNEMNRRIKMNIPTWDDFIESNRQMLENYISKEFQQQLKQGDIIISKEDVISLVQTEFHRYLTQLNTSIPELHDAIQGYIEQAMERYSIDISAKPDYALESSGAQVLSHYTSKSYHRNPEGAIAKAWANIFGMSGVLLGKSPAVALQPDTHAGNCWAMDGNHGFLTIQLSIPIIPSHITIEHMSQEESVPDSLLSSAPREIEIYGITNKEAIERMPSYHDQTLSLSTSPYAIHLASLVFDPRDNFIQTFPISNEAKIRLQSVTSIQVIQFQIYSNWGEDKYTCIYRVRVHGREPQLKDINFNNF